MKLNKIEKVDTSLIIANDEGEHLTVDVTITSKKYYSIRKINARISDMDFASVMTAVCKSSKKVEMFWVLLRSTNKYNQFSGVKAIADNNNYDYSALMKLIKDMIEIGFIKRIERGVYEVNPFQYMGKAVRSQEEMEQLQINW